MKICETRADAEVLWDATFHQSRTPKVHSKEFSVFTRLSPIHALYRCRDSLGGSPASEKGWTGMERNHGKAGSTHWQSVEETGKGKSLMGSGKP